MTTRTYRIRQEAIEWLRKHRPGYFLGPEAGA